MEGSGKSSSITFGIFNLRFLNFDAFILIIFSSLYHTSVFGFSISGRYPLIQRVCD